MGQKNEMIWWSKTLNLKIAFMIILYCKTVLQIWGRNKGLLRQTELKKSANTRTPSLQEMSKGALVSKSKGRTFTKNWIRIIPSKFQWHSLKKQNKHYWKLYETTEALKVKAILKKKNRIVILYAEVSNYMLKLQWSK